MGGRSQAQGGHTISIRKRLSLAACALVAPTLQAAENWQVDAGYLSYAEADGRVAVRKSLLNFDRLLDDGSMTIGLVHDSMSGASPTGGIRGDSSQVVFSSASGRVQNSNGEPTDNALKAFKDSRIQFSVMRLQDLNQRYTLNYGGVVSNEDDYESLGATVELKKESDNKLSALNAGFAITADSIYRGYTRTTPIPLGTTESPAYLAKGKRDTFDFLFGYTRVINRHTITQLNLSSGFSQGYHSDPYKIISAADENDRVVANFHDSRPDSRQRTSLYTKVVHQLENSENSVQFSYRFYHDDWGIQSNTVDARYHHKLTTRQYLEPHLRFYRQSAADFYQRKLPVDTSLDPLLPASGFASADYRLDKMESLTFGIKYGFKLNRNTHLRLRAEYLQQRFSTAEFETSSAVIIQSSLKYRF